MSHTADLARCTFELASPIPRESASGLAPDLSMLTSYHLAQALKLTQKEPGGFTLVVQFLYGTGL